RGGMGTVHRAVHLVTGHEVALKTVHPTGASVVASLRREIHALAQLRHPGIVRILEDGLQNGLPWYAMELVPGVTLRSFLTAGPTDGAEGATIDNPTDEGMATIAESHAAGEAWWTEQAFSSASWTAVSNPSMELDIITSADAEPSDKRRRADSAPPDWDLAAGLGVARKLCDVLAFLHGEGIVHRDLKPENIIVRGDGTPILVDFGLAASFTAHGGREVLDVPSSATGTAAYIAPEQAGGELVDARADLYSLGCILYEMVVGRPPFAGENAAVMRYQHTSLQPTPPSELTDKPLEYPGLEALIMRLLSKDPRRRLGHAADVATALERVGAAKPAPHAWPIAQSYLYRPAFVGRAHELKDLVAHFDGLDQRKGASAFVVGESGVGKTRLLLELGRQARRRGFSVFACQCAQPSGPEEELAVRGRPLEPLRPLLQRVADQARGGHDPELERLLAEQAQLLALYEPALMSVTGPLRLPPNMSPGAARHRLFASVEQTLAQVTSKRPAVLAIDDLQWADELTRGFVRYLITTRHGDRLPVLLIGTWRSEEAPGDLADVGSSDVQIANIGRLPERAVRSMVADMLALDNPPESLVQFLTEQSEGNPFFVGEYLHAALDERILQRDRSGHWQVPELTHPRIKMLAGLSLPSGMANLIGRRLDDLMPRARRLLKTAAVVGRVIRLDLLEAVAPLERDEFLGAMQELLRRQFMEERDQDRVAFAHSKLREVAYQRIPAEHRATLHRAVADEIERKVLTEPDHDLHAELGRHWECAGEPERATLSYLVAARATADQFAGEEAERLFRSALRLLPQDSVDAARVRLETAERVLLAAGATEEAIDEGALALSISEKARDTALIARSLRLLALSHQAAGRATAGLEHARAARDHYDVLGDRSGASEMLQVMSQCASGPTR
ncbi:MAG: serine/threonine protein kinase/tetratricopeptide (TPR) repeat protein, partial [Myxococcota bacterium]